MVKGLVTTNLAGNDKGRPSVNLSSTRNISDIIDALGALRLRVDERDAKVDGLWVSRLPRKVQWGWER